MRFSIGHMVGLGFGLALLILCVVGWLSYWSITKLLAIGEQRKQTSQLVGQFEELLSGLKDAETGQRGYLLTGDKDYLGPFDTGAPLVRQTIASLRNQSTDDPRRQGQFAGLERLITAKLDELSETVELTRRGDTDSALRIVRTNRGKDLMDEIRRSLAEIRDEENALLDRRDEEVKRQSGYTTLVIFLGSLLAFLLVGGAGLAIHGEIRERHRAEEDVRRYADVVNNAQIGVIVYQLGERADMRSLRLLSANPAASRLLGQPLHERLGLPIATVFPTVADDFLQGTAEVVRTGQPRDLGEIHYGDHHIAHAYWAVKAFPLPGDCVGVAFENVSARHQAEEASRRMNEELERRVELRTAELAQANGELLHRREENEAFVYSVSHDLRAPLVNLQGFSKELGLACQDLRGLFGEEQVSTSVRQRGLALLDGNIAEAVRFIQTSVMRLSNIIDALLRLSRAGRLEFQPHDIDVGEVVRRIVASLHRTVVEKAADVRVAAVPPLRADPSVVEQVFANLIGNALNYLDPRRPGVVEVGALAPDDPRDGRPGERTYFVRDNGRGISEAGKARVFQAFQRLHPDAAKGEGMGLAIVRRMLERHGGRIWFESNEGQGTTFYVVFSPRPP